VLLGAGMGAPPFITFIVLSCIGSATAILAVARFLPRSLIALLSLSVLYTAPLYGPGEVATASAADFLRNIWTRVALLPQPGEYMVMYPILPWVGFFGLGWVMAPVFTERRARASAMLASGGLLIVFGVALKWFGGTYGDRFATGPAGPFDAAFWAMAKYPPSPAFTSLTLGAMLVLIGALLPLDGRGVPAPLARFVAVYGRTALFFYVIHFYLLAVYPVATGQVSQFSLQTTYLVWVGVLVPLWPLCLLYGKLRSRYPRVLRYF
jgi:uncharacterized membrane protein